MPTSSGSSIRFSPGTPLHRQLFLVLRDQIAQGAFDATGALPKEEALCEQFGVSRITVRRALADLAAEGLVERRHGRGTFLREDLALAREIPTLSLLEGLRKAATETDVQVLQVSRSRPPAGIGLLLKLPAEDEAVHAIRLRSIRGTPVMLTDAWVPARHGKRVSATALRKKAMYEVLMDQGVEFGRAVQEISAVIAEPERAGLMQVDVGAPLLKVVRVMHDAAGQPVLHLTVYLSPERSRILMEIPGASVNTLSGGQFAHWVA